ncbi:MAG: histidinol-phosphate transaminase [Flavobacteriaceae bacterium]|nr:histidinol-phosphate transaminase [Flavobacteriaceae bacterium]
MKPVFDIKKWVRPSITALRPYASARDEFMSQGEEMLFLDANENPFQTAVNRYPDPNQSRLKELIAKMRETTKEQVFLGNGSDEILDLLFRAFCEPGKEVVLTMPPTFGMYKVLASLNQVENIEVPLTADFEIDIESVLRALTRNCKMILLCSPNNPTGTSFKSESISKILEAFDGLVVIDEAYIDFSPKPSWLSQLGNYPNLIVTQTLSKAYGQAGIRLGIAYADPRIIEVLHKIKLPYNVNVLTQEWAIKRIAQQEIIKSEIQEILNEKEALYRSLKDIPWIKELIPSDANFMLIRVDDGDRRYKQLIAKGIVVRNRSNQLHCENTLRITVGTPEENRIFNKIVREIR